MEWETPLGLPVVQPYYKTSAHLKKKISNTANLETLINPYMPNSVKQRNAFPPNFIHSLDACHMMLTALQCHRHGLTFASIHDCYWTHASSVDVMSKVSHPSLTFAFIHDCYWKIYCAGDKEVAVIHLPSLRHVSNVDIISLTPRSAGTSS